MDYLVGWNITWVDCIENMAYIPDFWRWIEKLGSGFSSNTDSQTYGIYSPCL